MTRPDIEEISKRYESRDSGRGGYGLWTDSITIHWPAIRDYIAELEKDAARYLWLRNVNKRMCYSTDFARNGKYGRGKDVDVIQITVDVLGDEPEFTPQGHFDYAHELDRAIDAAIAAAKEKP